MVLVLVMVLVLALVLVPVLVVLVVNIRSYTQPLTGRHLPGLEILTRGPRVHKPQYTRQVVSINRTNSKFIKKYPLSCAAVKSARSDAAVNKNNKRQRVEMHPWHKGRAKDKEL
ncbi:hypothetical protein CYMTET_25267 [Cymbomonas tetramitiformis]|uniref:Uncharacterized protein n=1 Tax=Cymbomonas tetramitiformis TaxID=36881 RepID=A0AAE0FUJ2_9CHLO|nr:hypothetical protein CYMTET_25267 [Cymbomonas tetramitiformis]